MAKVQVLNVAVLDNPSPFGNPFQFEITFECMEDLPEGRHPFGETVFTESLGPKPEPELLIANAVLATMANFNLESPPRCDVTKQSSGKVTLSLHVLTGCARHGDHAGKLIKYS